MKLSKKAVIAAACTGMLPAGAQAAALNQNLVANPSFETVVGTAAQIWSGNVSTYAYAQGYTAAAPAGAGLRYWNGGGPTPLATQVIDLSGNSAQIDGAGIAYNVSAFFSTYQSQHDFGLLRFHFLNAGNTEIGLVSLGGQTFVDALPLDGVNHTWGQDSRSGTVPVGTRSVQVELAGTKEANVGAVADPYMDLVHFEIVAVPEPGVASLIAVGLFGGCWAIRRRRS